MTHKPLTDTTKNWKQHHDDQVVKKQRLSHRYKDALATIDSLKAELAALSKLSRLTAAGKREYEELASLVADLEERLGCQSFGDVSTARKHIMGALNRLTNINYSMMPTPEQIIDAAFGEWESPDRVGALARVTALLRAQEAPAQPMTLTEDERADVEKWRNASPPVARKLIAIIDRLTNSRPSPGVQPISGGLLTAGQPGGAAHAGRAQDDVAEIRKALAQDAEDRKSWDGGEYSQGLWQHRCEILLTLYSELQAENARLRTTLTNELLKWVGVVLKEYKWPPEGSDLDWPAMGHLQRAYYRLTNPGLFKDKQP